MGLQGGDTVSFSLMIVTVEEGTKDNAPFNCGMVLYRDSKSDEVAKVNGFVVSILLTAT